MTRGTNPARSESLAKLVEKELTKLRGKVPIKASGVDTALAPKRDEILAALELGWTAGSLARVLLDAGAAYSYETLRLGIARIAKQSEKTVAIVDATLGKTPSTRKRSNAPNVTASQSERHKGSGRIPTYDDPDEPTA